MDSSDENGDGLMENEDVANIEELFEDDDDDDGDRDDNVGSVKEREIGDNDKKKEKLTQTTKRIVRKPGVVLNFERLRSQSGFEALVNTFEKFKFKGKHFEKEDLAAIMQNMQHWMCHHLYPGYDVETCVKALEKLGKKKVVQVHMRRMRQEARSSNWENKENVSDNTFVCPASVNEDNFDELLREEPMEV